MTERDKKLLVVFAFVVALGILGIWLPKARVAWETAKLRLEQGQTQLARERAVVALRPVLEEQYAQLRATMPSFPEGVALDTTHWLPLVDNLATANNVSIVRRAVGNETTHGTVTELPIRCTDWQGRLDSLVDFLYQVENQEGAMMDVRAITISPDTKTPGMLKGTFTINCAYTRRAATTDED